MEQKVWIDTTSRLYPNLYTFLVGPPGVGKTRVITRARAFLSEITGLRIAPTSVTAASLVDYLAESGQAFHFEGDHETYNSVTLLQDDWQALMSSFDKQLIAALTIFYDANPYSESRRTNSLRHSIERPQLNVIAGTTPVGLMDNVPLSAWGQGFTSRVILVYSADSIVGDDFAGVDQTLPGEMIDDLLSIAGLKGPFKITEEFRNLVNAWRQSGEIPKPSHPKLLHYNARRRAMVYKLAMVAAVDVADELVLTGDCFRRALHILGQAEISMPGVFEHMAVPDAQCMDEIVAWVAENGDVTGEQLVRRMSRTFPHYAIGNTFKLMTATGMLEETKGVYRVRRER